MRDGLNDNKRGYLCLPQGILGYVKARDPDIQADVKDLQYRPQAPVGILPLRGSDLNEKCITILQCGNEVRKEERTFRMEGCQATRDSNNNK